MARVRLIHWKPAEAVEQVAWLRAAGHEVDATPFDGKALRAMRDKPPEAILLDLSRAPSQGRDLGLSLRKFPETRHVPLVFAGGSADKVARIRDLLPDAFYAEWAGMAACLDEALAHPPADPVVPDSVFAAYAGTPLPKKLGIKPGSIVALVGGPSGFGGTLGALPEGARVVDGERPEADLTLWFVRDRQELEAGVVEMGRHAAGGGLWIVWPKTASGVQSDLTQAVVRRTGLDAGLVDFKICSVDETWSGLRFSQRKEG
jgi:hypothetical protein